MVGVPQAEIGNLSDPRGFARYRDEFLDWLGVKNYAESTIQKFRIYLNLFILWAEERGIYRPHEVNRKILERYQRYLFHYRMPNGRGLSVGTQCSRITPLKSYFKWLAKQNFILFNPSSELDAPKMEHRLPKHVLTVSEVETILSTPNIETEVGLRDRSILETLYSTGMRRTELTKLKLIDLDTERGTVMIRQGKGKKDRMVPIGERALSWIAKYVEEVRKEWVLEPDDGTLYLTPHSEAMVPERLSQMVGKYVKKADIGKTGACHMFRHAMATLMLEHGADIRYIQRMLGHAKLDTTQLYTKVSIRKLKEMHTATHPGARLGRSFDLEEDQSIEF